MSLLAEQIGHIATWTPLAELGYAAPADQYSSHTHRCRLRKVYPRELYQVSEQEKRSVVQAARVYLRVSTEEQDLARQEAIIAGARAAGFYVAAVYREKASGARPDRPELLRMVADLQPGEVVVAEKIDRISRLPLPEAELLVATITGKGARLAVPGIVDLSDLVADSSGVARIVLEAVQAMLLRVALQTARDDYETRRERQREGIEIARRAGL